ncbi:cytidylyltransferase [Niveomyces insectorum RCEF 264]|uniref:dolichol kinase n=1 Tax=Niveomyces insectorum RCEF 264 TaxID=1081102 RepID=A0A167MFH2_9HYPO|nr:cytidylyltransferase [Niveomyces insectorum RCEF 264]
MATAIGDHDGADHSRIESIHDSNDHPPDETTLLLPSAALNQPAPDQSSGDVPNPGPSVLRPLARSPHPYHRNNNYLIASARTTPPASTDSGTEADDEHFLKGLPAPRAKPHKGLRGVDESLSGVSTPRWPSSSPALRPRRVLGDDAAITATTGVSNGTVAGTASAAADSGGDERRQSRQRRRRRELVRRVTELLLLLVQAGLVANHPGARPQIGLWRRELGTTAGIVGGLVVLYPLRRLILRWARHRQQRTSPSTLQTHTTTTTTPTTSLGLPVVCDPAPLVYPLALPLFVALLVATPTLPAAPLLNLVLALCTLPATLVPRIPGLHWALSCLPMAVAQNTLSADKRAAMAFVSTTPPFTLLAPETATLLYPLHHTLCQLLQDLATTSLLPAERQLLAVALTNLLVLAASPQAVILQAVLWGGGVGLLLTSTGVVRGGITLARVPRWRFRKVEISEKETSTVSSSSSSASSSSSLSAMTVVVLSWLSAGLRSMGAVLKAPRRARLEMMFGAGDRKQDDWVYRQDASRHASNPQDGPPPADLAVFAAESDSDVARLRTCRWKQPKRVQQGASLVAAQPHDTPDQPVKEAPWTVSSTVGVQEFPPRPAFASDELSAPLRTEHAPRNADCTFAAAQTAHSHTQHTHTPSGRPKRAASARVRALFSLTHAQAVRRTWLYAACLYGAIFTVLLGPVRAYVAAYALHGHEPVGWALGYLLGDLPGFRLEVVKAQLEYWVCLPRRAAASDAHACCSAGWMEHIRQAGLGPASTRLVLGAYWVAVLAFGLSIVVRLGSSSSSSSNDGGGDGGGSGGVAIDTRRKVFHLTMVAVLLPATYVDPAYAALALALVLAVFLLLDLVRASQLPPLSRPLAAFLAPYVDGRDLRGPVVVSHMFLLVGCAVPLWLDLAALPRSGTGRGVGDRINNSDNDSADCSRGWDLSTRDVGMVAGVVCVGLGDAAASLVGRRWGRHKWRWGGGKSLEGSAAFAAAVVTGLVAARVWLRVGGWATTTTTVAAGAATSTAATHQTTPPTTTTTTSSLARAGTLLWAETGQTVPRFGLCASLASLTEAVLTGGNDNVVVPVLLWTCVKSFEL